MLWVEGRGSLTTPRVSRRSSSVSHDFVSSTRRHDETAGRQVDLPGPALRARSSLVIFK